MTAVNQDFSLVKGDDHEVLIAVADENGDDVDLTTASAISWECADLGGAAAFSKALGTGITVENVNDMRVALDAADTDTLTKRVYRHCARVTIATKLSTVTLGKITVLQC